MFVISISSLIFQLIDKNTETLTSLVTTQKIPTLFVSAWLPHGALLLASADVDDPYTLLSCARGHLRMVSNAGYFVE